MQSDPASTNQTWESVIEQKTAPETEPNRERLLAQVLGETLSRQHNDATSLLEMLRPWRMAHGDVEFVESICLEMVAELLRHRLGTDAILATEQLYGSQMYEEVGAALWSNPESRSRMLRLWKSLGKREQ